MTFSLSVWDYVVFIGLLVVSFSIGIVIAIKDKLSKNTTTDSFLLAGRSMGVFPVALSLTVGFISAILILGVPVDIYIHGTMYLWFIVAFFIACGFAAEIYVPVYRKIRVASAYQYLELRFNRTLRMIATTAYILQSIGAIGVVIYAPALALSAVTGFNLWIVVISTGFTCILYCALGGLKATIFIDVLQALVMVAGQLVVIIPGCVFLGGFGNVWEKAYQGGRIEFFNFNPDPRERYTVWSVTVGGTFLAISLYGVNQAAIQRYQSSKTSSQAKKAVMFNAINLAILNLFAGMCGLVLYAYYKECDPLKSGKILAPDQLLPYLVVDMLRDYPGLPGLFMAGVYSGSLSTIAAGVNGMACVTLQDYIKPFTDWKDKSYALLSKGLICIYGLICIIMAYVTSLLGKQILQVIFTLAGIIGGPTVGVFNMGILIPQSNSKGAIAGYVCGASMTTWIFIGSLIYPPLPQFQNILPLSTDGCATPSPLNTTMLALTAGVYESQRNTSGVFTTPFGFFNDSIATASTVQDSASSLAFTSSIGYLNESMSTTSSAPTPTSDRPAIAEFYSVSYIYYSFIGFLTCTIVGVTVSLITGGHKQTSSINPDLIFPIFDHWIFSWLSEDTRRKLWFGVKHEEEKKRSAESDDDAVFDKSVGEECVPLANGNSFRDMKSSVV